MFEELPDDIHDPAAETRACLLGELALIGSLEHDADLLRVRDQHPAALSLRVAEPLVVRRLQKHQRPVETGVVRLVARHDLQLDVELGRPFQEAVEQLSRHVRASGATLEQCLLDDEAERDRWSAVEQSMAFPAGP
ncbi:hypothetical protein GCM10023238_06440 [Streptomyces heliomycini]